jgi:hypothetical protein
MVGFPETFIKIWKGFELRKAFNSFIGDWTNWQIRIADKEEM